MMQDKKSLSSSSDVEDVNISPLIDMVFILLIFFIVTTVFVQEPGIEVDKPKASLINSPDLEKNVILIAVTPQGQIMYGGTDVGLGGIRLQVRRLIDENPDYPVIIQADQLARSGTIVRLIDECKLGKAKRIFVSTEPSEG
ncbi:MAG: biopolymer transporter ExbD [Verrucomicrobiota bacterium]